MESASSRKHLAYITDAELAANELDSNEDALNQLLKAKGLDMDRPIAKGYDPVKQMTWYWNLIE